MSVQLRGVAPAADNFRNLFEVPVLFYALLVGPWVAFFLTLPAPGAA